MSGRIERHHLPAPEFTPVPHRRNRHDGWTPECQARFLEALAVVGSVAQAAKAVGKSRATAYALRERPGAESFAAAWDRAISLGRSMMFDWAMETALNGVTTVRVLRGGAINVSAGPNMQMVTAAIREPPYGPPLTGQS